MISLGISPTPHKCRLCDHQKKKELVERFGRTRWVMEGGTPMIRRQFLRAGIALMISFISPLHSQSGTPWRDPSPHASAALFFRTRKDREQIRPVLWFEAEVAPRRAVGFGQSFTRPARQPRQLDVKLVKNTVTVPFALTVMCWRKCCSKLGADPLLISLKVDPTVCSIPTRPLS